MILNPKKIPPMHKVCSKNHIYNEYIYFDNGYAIATNGNVYICNSMFEIFENFNINHKELLRDKIIHHKLWDVLTKSKTIKLISLNDTSAIKITGSDVQFSCSGINKSEDVILPCFDVSMLSYMPKLLEKINYAQNTKNEYIDNIQFRSKDLRLVLDTLCESSFVKFYFYDSTKEIFVQNYTNQSYAIINPMFLK